ncbi:MAG: hypothetical protein QXT45_05410 [Candidatus Bilamarchaeaceae archaeon]
MKTSVFFSLLKITIMLLALACGFCYRAAQALTESEQAIKNFCINRGLYQDQIDCVVALVNCGFTAKTKELQLQKVQDCIKNFSSVKKKYMKKVEEASNE